jgi:hypothetical protein
MWRLKVLALVAASAIAVGCGSGSGSLGSESKAEPCRSDDPSPCDSSTTTMPPKNESACGAATEEVVTAALDEMASLVATDATQGCEFTAGDWWLAVTALRYDPATQGKASTSPTILGVTAPHSVFVGPDRGGLWQARGSMVVNDRLYIFTLRDSARGEDTYPPSEGSGQRSRIFATAASVLNTIAEAENMPRGAD